MEGDPARRVIDQIGSQAIENANRNEASIQCYRPISGGEPYCEIDRWWWAGWEVLGLGGPVLPGRLRLDFLLLTPTVSGGP